MARTFLTLTTPATSYPVTLAEVKASARIDSADEDPALLSYIAVATRSVEEMSGRALLSQAWQLQTYGLSGNGELPLPKAPIVSISAITYQDTDDVTQTMNVSDFLLIGDDYKAHVEPKDGTQWPSTYDRPDAISVSFVAGYASPSDVPEGLRHAIVLLATHWFEHRTPVSAEKAMPIPFAVEHLVNLDRTGWVAA